MHAHKKKKTSKTILSIQIRPLHVDWGWLFYFFWSIYFIYSNWTFSITYSPLRAQWSENLEYANLPLKLLLLLLFINFSVMLLQPPAQFKWNCCPNLFLSCLEEYEFSSKLPIYTTNFYYKTEKKKKEYSQLQSNLQCHLLL